MPVAARASLKQKANDFLKEASQLQKDNSVYVNRAKKFKLVQSMDEMLQNLESLE